MLRAHKLVEWLCTCGDIHAQILYEFVDGRNYLELFSVLALFKAEMNLNPASQKEAKSDKGEVLQRVKRKLTISKLAPQAEGLSSIKGICHWSTAGAFFRKFRRYMQS